MGLITLIFLIAFTALYLSKSLQSKPAFLTTAVDKITAHLDQVALWGAIYGLVAAALSLITGYSGLGMLIRFICNIMVVLMALPYVLDQGVAKFREKVNPAILQEARNLVGWIVKQEKYVGYAGAGLSVLLFAVIFE